MRRGALVLAAAMLAVSLQYARASPMLALELWINGACTHRTLLVEMHGEDVVVLRRELSEEGIVFSDSSSETHVALGAATPIRATVDAGGQRLLLTAPTKNLAPRIIDLHPAAPLPVDDMTTGLILDYDLSAQAGDLGDIAHSYSLGLASSVSAFTPYGVLRGSGFVRSPDTGTQGARLDTAFLIDEPDKVQRWSIGDSISGGLSWSRAERFAGVQLASDYTLRPDLVTIPLPQFFGSTAVPASVDVFIGATKVFETDVDPGPFELRNLPIVTGGSEATVFVQDALGRQTAQTIALYDTSDLLAPGLSEYSLEAGFLRDGYGVRNFDYGQPMASATWRHGLSNILTFQAHGEAARDVQMAGGGVVLALEPYATFGLDVAGSAHDGRDGTLAAFSVHGQWRRFTFFGDYRAASSGYADLTVLDQAPAERRHLQLGASASFGACGSLSISSIDQDLHKSAPSRLVAATYSLDMGGRFLSLNSFYDRRTGNWYAGFTLNILLGHNTVAVAAGDVSDDSRTGRLAYQHDGDPDGGFGYRAEVSAGQGTSADFQGVWYGDRLTADGDLSVQHGGAGARLGIDGSLVELGGNLYASRQSDGAVALVETGAPNIRIYRENRQVAVSDANGEAMVPGLVPFAANRIAVDPDDYPLTTVVEHNERIVVPRRYGGAAVDLAPPRRAPVLVTIRLENGLFPPPGSRATLGGEPLVIGRNGKLFIDDLHADADVTVELPDGTCKISIAAPARGAKHIPSVGPLLCRGAAQHAA